MNKNVRTKYEYITETVRCKPIDFILGGPLLDSHSEGSQFTNFHSA
jgi:hypothetical protein